MTVRSTPAISFDHVGKVYCENIDLARSYAFRDMLKPTRRRAGELRRGEFFALRDVSLEVHPRRPLLVFGTPGSGKTTLAKLLCGLLRPDEGRIERRGRTQLVGGGRLGLNPFMTVREYVDLTSALLGVRARGEERHARVVELAGLRVPIETRVGDVPRAQTSLLVLAVSLLAEPDFFVFDERLALDPGPVGDALLERAYEALQDRGGVIISGRAKGLPPFVEKALVLHGGRAIYEGPAERGADLFSELLAEVRSERSHAARAREREPVPRVEPLARDSGASPAVRPLASPASLEQEIERAVCRGQPLIVGPWTAKPALEILYWLPFLTWARASLAQSPRLVAVSRYGADRWYRARGFQYVDVLDVMDAGAYHARIAAGEMAASKQGDVSDLDRDIVSKVASRLTLGDAAILHPDVLLRAARALWGNQESLELLERHARYERLPPLPPSERLRRVPDRYVLFRAPGPSEHAEAEAERARIDAIARRLVPSAPVVIVTGWSGTTSDPAPDFEMTRRADGAFVLRVRPGGRRTLELLTRAVAFATVVVGTAGPESYLAPLYGVRSLFLRKMGAKHASAHARVFDRMVERLGAPTIGRPAESLWKEDTVEWIESAWRQAPDPAAAIPLAGAEPRA